MLQPGLNEREVEKVIAGHQPPGRPDLAEVAFFFARLRTLGDFEQAPPMSPQLLAELDAAEAEGATGREAGTGAPAAPAMEAGGAEHDGLGPRRVRRRLRTGPVPAVERPAAVDAAGVTGPAGAFGAIPPTDPAVADTVPIGDIVPVGETVALADVADVTELAELAERGPSRRSAPRGGRHALRRSSGANARRARRRWQLVGAAAAAAFVLGGLVALDLRGGTERPETEIDGADPADTGKPSSTSSSSTTPAPAPTAPPTTAAPPATTAPPDTAPQVETSATAPPGPSGEGDHDGPHDADHDEGGHDGPDWPGPQGDNESFVDYWDDQCERNPHDDFCSWYLRYRDYLERGDGR